MQNVSMTVEANARRMTIIYGRDLDGNLDPYFPTVTVVARRTVYGQSKDPFEVRVNWKATGAQVPRFARLYARVLMVASTSAKRIDEALDFSDVDEVDFSEVAKTIVNGDWRLWDPDEAFPFDVTVAEATIDTDAGWIMYDGQDWSTHEREGATK